MSPRISFSARRVTSSSRTKCKGRDDRTAHLECLSEQLRKALAQPACTLDMRRPEAEPGEVGEQPARRGASFSPKAGPAPPLAGALAGRGRANRHLHARSRCAGGTLHWVRRPSPVAPATRLVGQLGKKNLRSAITT